MPWACRPQSWSRGVSAVRESVIGRVLALCGGDDVEEWEIIGAVPLHSDESPGVEIDLVDAGGERQLTLRIRLSTAQWTYLYPHLMPRGRRGG